MRSICTVVLLVLFGATPSLAQRGAITVPRNLGELTDQAATILRGTVVNVRVEPLPELSNLWTVVVTMNVREVLKGKADSTFTFRQFIWDIRDRYDAAGYRKGQDLLLLLNPLTRFGLSSPAGLEQGRFSILRDRQGQELAVNAHGNAGLFRDLASQMRAKGVQLSPRLSALIAAAQTGPVPLDDLRELIRRWNGVK